ncbi:MAG: tetratricopeptide repeat protein [Spirochaetota bacterium]
MSRKKSRKRTQPRLLPVSAAERKLDAIVPLLTSGEPGRALDLLLAMRGRYRLPGRYYAVRARAHEAAGRDREDFIVELVDAAPDHENDALFQITTSAEYARYGRIFAAHRAAVLARDHAREPDLRTMAEGFVHDLEVNLANAGRDYRLRVPEELDTAVRFDEAVVLFLAERNREAIERLQDQVSRVDDSSAIRDILANARWSLGRYDEAIETVGNADDADFLPLAADGARYHSMLGDTRRASEFVRRLTDRELTLASELYVVCVALAVAGEDTRIIDLLGRYAGLRKQLNAGDAEEIVRYEATALARTGDEARARELWRGIARHDHVARMNLENLDLPADERLRPWYVGLGDVIPDEADRMVADSGEKDEASFREEMLDAFPEIAKLVPFLGTQSDGEARAFARWIAGDSGTHYGRPGITSARAGYKAAVEVDGYTVSYEPEESHAPDAAEIAQRGYDLYREDRPEEAIACFQKAIRMHGESPTLLNNLAAAYDRAGHHDEAHEMVRSLYERFPDYFFARLGAAVLEAVDGRTSEAREIVRPLLARTSQHVTEFTGLCNLMCRIASEERDVEELQQWLSRWETVDPDDDRLEVWQMSAALLGGLDRFTKLASSQRASASPKADRDAPASLDRPDAAEDGRQRELFE